MPAIGLGLRQMLADFITTNRDQILAQARARVAARPGPVATDALHAQGLPTFLDQLGHALRKKTPQEIVDHNHIKDSGGLHGAHLFEQGLTIAQVINSYGDICQVVTGLAMELGAPIAPAEFQMLNLCLDEATAGAVTAFSGHRERVITDEGTERLGVLAHELRNALNAAMISFDCIKKGTVATSGSTSAILDRSFLRLQALIDRSLADVRLDAGLLHLVRVPVWELLEEAEIGASLVAQSRGVRLEVSEMDHNLVVEADRSILTAAIANLLQNAFKFTRPETTVVLRATSTTTRVHIEVRDHCGGLPAGSATSLLRPFVQRDRDRSGLGLGLSICVKAMTMMAGQLHIRDIPGEGCVFTIDLPKQPPPPTSIHGPRRNPGVAGGGSSGQLARAR